MSPLSHLFKVFLSDNKAFSRTALAGREGRRERENEHWGMSRWAGRENSGKLGAAEAR